MKPSGRETAHRQRGRLRAHARRQRRNRSRRTLRGSSRPRRSWSSSRPRPAESGTPRSARRDLSLGVHFTLTGGGPPAAAARAVPTLAPGGRFPRTAGELPRRIPEAEVRAELEAQIEIFQVLARRPPTHLDSHHHAALHPDVAPVFAAVARERSLPARAVDDDDRNALREAGVRTPDRFFDGLLRTGRRARGRSSGSSRRCRRRLRADVPPGARRRALCAGPRATPTSATASARSCATRSSARLVRVARDRARRLRARGAEALTC